MMSARKENAPGHGGENITLRRHHTQPAYAKQLAEARARGLRLSKSLVVALSWGLGQAFPRLVVPEDFDIAAGDFSAVRGLDCIVAHRGEIARALAVAAACLRAGAWPVVTLDAETGQTVYSADLAEIVGLRRAA